MASTLEELAAAIAERVVRSRPIVATFKKPEDRMQELVHQIAVVLRMKLVMLPGCDSYKLPGKMPEATYIGVLRIFTPDLDGSSTGPWFDQNLAPIGPIGTRKKPKKVARRKRKRAG